MSQVMNYLPQTLQLPHLRRAITPRTSCVLEWFLFSIKIKLPYNKVHLCVYIGIVN